MASTSHDTTQGRVISMFHGLTGLAGRQNANRAADTKVARLLRIVDVHSQPLIDKRIKIAGDLLEGIEDPEGISDVVAQQLSARIAAAQTEFDATEITIDLPDTPRIVEDDLPKARKGENGWQNAAGVSAFVFGLGPLYDFQDPEAEEQQDANLEPGEDPDASHESDHNDE